MALEKLKSAGVRTAALICPVIPHISNVEPLIARIAPHADTIWVYGLSRLNHCDSYWRNIDGILRDHFPKEKARIQKAIESKHHPYWQVLKKS